MGLPITVLSIIGTFATLSACGGVINSNGSQAVAVLGRDGIPMPVLDATLDLDYFDDNLNITKRDDSDWLTNVTVLPLAGSDITSVESGVLDKRTDREESYHWVSGAGNCAWGFWDIADGFWQAGWDFIRMTSAGNCATVMGTKGAFYYKYYPTSPDCSSTTHQKIITGALEVAIKSLDDNKTRNVYMFRVNRHGSWHGDIVISGSPAAWYSSSRNRQFKGCLNIGCSGLQSLHSCE